MKRDRPWMPFYTADWTTNLKLKRCTHEEKGVWIDIATIRAPNCEWPIS